MAPKNKLEEVSKVVAAKLGNVPREFIDYVQVMLHSCSMDMVYLRMFRNEALSICRLL